MRPYTLLKFKGTKEEINEQWREARHNGVGGSDVASIMGLNKFSSPLEVWLLKTGREKDKDLSDNQKVEWGVILEDVVADKFKSNHKDEFDVYRKNSMIVSKARPWAFANLDRYLVDRKTKKKGILEIKTADARRASDWDEGVPDYYLTQVTHYLSVTGYDFAVVAVLIGGNDYREFFIERDSEDIEAVNNAVDNFWHNFVVKDVAPALIGNQAESYTLLQVHNDPTDDFVEVLDADVSFLDEYIQLKEEKKCLEDRMKLYENQLKEVIGDSKGLITESRKVTWVRSQSQQFDKSRFATEHPELVEAYSQVKPKNMGLRISER